MQGKTYNLFGEPVTQLHLTNAINKAYNLNLEYKSISIESYRKERQAAHGEFLGTVIGGIYEGIKMGKSEGKSDFVKVINRAYKTIEKMVLEFINQKC